MERRPPIRESEPQRLQKILAAAGVASRRAAEDLIRAGQVTVNGRRARLGDSARADVDAIAVDGHPVRRERLAYWILHKPRGVLTTVSDPHGRATVVELLPRRAGRLFPVGRLDRDSEGLVLLTNDGTLAHVLLHPSFEKQREYRVTVRGRVLEETRRRIERGIDLEEGRTAPARIASVRYDRTSDTTVVRLILIEGRKRQIRRMLAALGHPVIRLLRIRMGPLRLGALEPGEARVLSAAERQRLERLRDGSRPRSRSRTRS
jgi:23S rRNA pseudouridine2605 synthase